MEGRYLSEFKWFSPIYNPAISKPDSTTKTPPRPLLPVRSSHLQTVEVDFRQEAQTGTVHGLHSAQCQDPRVLSRYFHISSFLPLFNYFQFDPRTQLHSLRQFWRTSTGRRWEEDETSWSLCFRGYGVQDTFSCEGSVGDVHEVRHGREVCLLNLGASKHAGGVN